MFLSGFIVKLEGLNSKLETPLTIRQVETHLVFGPISRHLPLGYLAWLWAIGYVIWNVFDRRQSGLEYFVDVAHSFLLLIVPILMARFTMRQQAILAWLSVKMTLGFGAVMMATVGAAVAFQRGQSDAWPDLFLGLIWIPWIEFIPRVTPHQKYVTIARLLLSIPCVIFGIKSGYWHWE